MSLMKANSAELLGQRFQRTLDVLDTGGAAAMLPDAPVVRSVDLR
jgi:hypothetical protein